MKENVVVVYGSGASHASGYKVRVREKVRGRYFDQSIAPPTDQKFFIQITDEFLEAEYHALWQFKNSFFGPNSGVGMEEVWTALDLNHKHITLDTYDWSTETAEYKNGTTIRYPFMGCRPPCIIHHGTFNTPSKYNRHKFLGDCGRDFRRLVYSVYSDYEMSDKPDTYKCFHEVLKNSNFESIGYITFNYDCYLEDSLDDQPFKYITDNCNSQSIKMLFEGGVPIVKLHGSLNWEERYYGTSHRITYHAPPYSQEMQVEPGYRYDDDWSQPAIIPPTIFKQEINDDSRIGNPLTATILQQWRAALTLLENADKIIFVGYSFPKTDFHSKRIFQISSMRRRSRDRQAVGILDCIGTKTEKGKKEEFLESIFGDDTDPEFVCGFDQLLASAELKKFLDIQYKIRAKA